MNNRARLITFIFCFGIPSLCLTGRVEGSWQTFRSEIYHFTVRYPASWYRMSSPKGTLDILNFPPSQRLEGAVLRKGGADISVMPSGVSSPLPVRTLDDWIGENTRSYTNVKRRKIGTFPKNPSGCVDLVEVTSLLDDGPGTPTNSTAYYCSTGHSLYRIWLSNRNGDPNQAHLRAIALKIALSLRER